MNHWHGFHLYYHGNLDLLLSYLVHPLVSELAKERLIDGFFFIRYRLGGPHVRLRLRMADGVVDEARAKIETNATRFFAKNPSPTTLTDDEIRRSDEFILATDPNERATGIVPSPSVCVRPFVPETQRYGGPDLLAHSLDYFGISSAHVLRFLERHADSPQTKRLPAIVRHLVAEAAGFAANADEALHILAPHVEGFGDGMQRLLERADNTYQSQTAGFGQLVRDALESNDVLTTAAMLGASIHANSTETRLRIARSQVHMSANRFGLTNVEEAYIRRMAWLATNAVFVEETSLRARIDAEPTLNGSDAAMALREAASRALTSLAAT